jgi:hypothetical protein
MLRRVVWWKFTDVSKVLAASIIRGINSSCQQSGKQKDIVAL